MPSRTIAICKSPNTTKDRTPDQFFPLSSPHNGRGFTFFQLIKAMVLVYNISYPLAFLLTSAAFLTCGKLSFHSDHHDRGLLWRPRKSDNSFLGLFLLFIHYIGSLAIRTFRQPSWTLDLQSLSRRGTLMIAHDGSFVHPDGKPSTSPDPDRVGVLLQQASTARDSKGDLKGGLDFSDIVRIRTERVLSPAHPVLSGYHEQISLGECGLLWEVFRDRTGALKGVIPTYKLQRLLGEEMLPDEWWATTRPKKTIGLLRARRTADEVSRLSKQIAEEAGIRKVTI